MTAAALLGPAAATTSPPASHAWPQRLAQTSALPAPFAAARLTSHPMTPPGSHPGLDPAQGSPGADQANTAGTQQLMTVVGNIVAWITGILASVATLFLTVSGLRYLMSGGDPSEVTAAKAALKSAVIGYAVAALAPALVSVVGQLVGGTR